VLLPLALLFVVVPLVELAVIIQVGQIIGVLPTIAILVVDSMIGAVLLRAQGRAAWLRFNATLRSGRVPAREVIDGALVIFGGALLLTPGFITDFLGLALLFPPTRAAVRAVLARRLTQRMVVAATGGRAPRRQPADVEGTAVDVDEPHGARNGHSVDLEDRPR
jgi:UPF0716 protein FxsA